MSGINSLFHHEAKDQVDFFKTEKEALIKAAGQDLQFNDPKYFPHLIMTSKPLTESEAKEFAKKIQDELKLPEKSVTTPKSSDAKVGHRVAISLQKLGESLNLIPEEKYLKFIKSKIPPEAGTKLTYRYSSDKENILAIAGAERRSLAATMGLTETAGSKDYEGVGAELINPHQSATKCFAFQISLVGLKQYLPPEPH